MLVISSLTASAQPPFETHYGSSSTGGDGYSTEMVTCASIDPNNYTYAAVHAIRDLNVTPPAYMIRGVRIKSDGTMYTSNFDYIRESSGDYDVFPLKIIPINNNTEYMITGYVTHTNTPNLPHPFVIRTDAALLAFEFKVFTDHPGFFTDVDQLSGGDFIFCGSMTNSLQILANTRLGWMLRTDNTYTKQWMRYTYSYNHSSSVMRKDFDIVHDLILIDDDSAIVCGNITEQLNCNISSPNLDSSSNIAFIAKVNLYDGSFGWYKSRIKLANASRLAMNSAGTMIAFATNGELSNNYPGVSFWDRAGNYIYGTCFYGNNLSGVNFRLNGNNYPNSTIYFSSAPSVIQNIYFNSNNDLFISGKYFYTEVKDNTSSSLGYFDIPFNTVYNAGTGTVGNINIYKSAQGFTGISNFLSYKFWNDVSNCNIDFPQVYTASNTLPCLANCGTDEYVTVTLDVASDANTTQTGPDKIWIFSNDNNPCGREQTTSNNPPFPIFAVSLVMYNDDILVTPDVDDYNYNNSTPGNNPHNCEQ